jgi:hypothetical protein
MADFEVPDLPEPIRQGLETLLCTAQSPFPAKHFADLSAETGLSIDEMGGSTWRRILVGERTFLFRFHIQVDEVTSVSGGQLTLGENSPDYQVYCQLEVSATSEGDRQPEDHPEWAKLFHAVQKYVGQVTAYITLRLMVPSVGTVTAVRLPIPLGSTEVAGFSEVRGVRLSQLDKSVHNSNELYSVILDYYGESLAVDVRTPGELPLTYDMLGAAVQQSWPLAQQAVPSLRRLS